MKYVLDASVAVKFVLPEHDSAKALALEADFRNQIHDLISPDTFGQKPWDTVFNHFS